MKCDEKGGSRIMDCCLRKFYFSETWTACPECLKINK